ncbi:hypothetical protein C6T65_21140 [Burkholderia vietnamiensis]|uniref:Uncharacterized protein n=1 Tax=Burkholderia vietnamiensis TaxID=60552 RepID=A0AA45BCC5_BURVI|nr:hypothetical protein C6T65_21140 [Burkholderia vietnamiensis]
MLETISLPEVRKPFVIGLIWRYEEHAPSLGVLRKLAESDGDWGIVRKSAHGVVQVGQGEPIPGRKAGEFRSLAATIADAHPQPWVGRYALDDGREWLVAVHDEHGILPDGDRVGTPEEIDEAIHGFGSESEWNQVSGGIDDLVDLVRGARKTPALQDLTVGPWRRWGVPAACLSLVAVVGAVGAIMHARQVRLDEQERTASIRAFNQRQAAAAQAARAASPWAHDAGANTVIRTCGDRWDSQHFERDGWLISSWNCEAHAGKVSVNVGWNRAGGLAANAPGSLEDGGEHSVENIDGPSLPAAAAGNAQIESEARRAIWTFAQRYGLKLVLTGGGMPKLPGSSVADDAAPMWGVTTVTFETSAPPWTLGADFDEVPALRVHSISFDLQKQMWRIEADMYHSIHAVTAGTKARK